MSLVVPNRRLAQPVIGSSPIPGVRALFDMRWGVDLITGRLASANTATRAVGPGGQTYDFSGSANTEFAHHPNYAITGQLTIIAQVDIDALSNYGALVSKQATATTLMPYELRLGRSPSDSYMHFVRANTTQNSFDTGSSRISASTKLNMVAVLCPSSDVGVAPTVFVNGSFFTTSGAGGTGSGAATDNGSSSVRIGQRASGTTQLDGRVYWVALVDRMLDNAEVLRIWANPSIIFPTQPRRSRVGVAAPPSGFLAAWAHRRARAIGAGVH